MKEKALIPTQVYGTGSGEVLSTTCGYDKKSAEAIVSFWW
jgi:hypothetical protein